MSYLSVNDLISDRAKNERGESPRAVALRAEGGKLISAPPDTFILGVPDKSVPIKMQNYTFGEIDLSATLLAKHLAPFLPTRAVGDVASKLTVALLAPSNYDCGVCVHVFY